MRVTIVGAAGVGALATSFAEGATQLAHEAAVIDVPDLAGGSRALFLARRVHLEEMVATPVKLRLRRTLEALQPDLVLVVKGRFLSARSVSRLRHELNVPILNYYPDHPLWPGHDDAQMVEALEEYDELLVWGHELAARLRERGLRQVRVIPFGYDANVYSPRPDGLPFRWDAAVIGQCYEQRLRFTEALAEFELHVTGLGWSRAAADGPLAGKVGEQTLPGRETCSRYWRSRVALNVLADSNVPAHNMRSYEIPASRTAMVATRTPDHEALFGEDGAMLVSTPQEAREAVGMLLADDELRERIARTGRERVEPHTYAARMREVLAPWERKLLA